MSKQLALKNTIQIMTSANWFEWNAGNMIRSMYKQIHSAISERNENMFAYSAMEIFGMYVFKQMLWFYAWLRFAGSHSLCSPWMCKYVDRQVPIMRIAFHYLARRNGFFYRMTILAYKYNWIWFAIFQQLIYILMSRGENSVFGLVTYLATE